MKEKNIKKLQDICSQTYCSECKIKRQAIELGVCLLKTSSKYYMGSFNQLSFRSHRMIGKPK